MFGNASFGARRVLVVYYSMTGNTARVARDLGRTLGADVESVQDKGHGVGLKGYLKATIDAVRGIPAQIGEPTRNPADYSLVIIGTPVWAWHMTPAIRAYLQRFKASLNDVAFFVTSGDTDVAQIVPSLELVSGHKALASAGFSAQELSDRRNYEGKLTDFVNALGGVVRARPQPGVKVDAAVHAR
jgi:flavodoxin